jgi:hypothetical protein
MAELKTKLTDASVEAFLNTLEDESKRKDAQTILQMMQDVTGEAPRMWGNSIVGFGSYRYKYASGKEGDWMLTGFSPRKQNLTLYIMSGFEINADIMSRLGKHTTGKGCLYIKKLKDVDPTVLRELITKSVEHTRTSKP